MGLDAQQMLQNDPEYLARQLARKEIQQYQNFQNPQLGLAATGGAVIGRGLANLFGGRGFFETSDPALRKVSEVQSLYNEAMQSFDPDRPDTSYSALAKTLAERGYGREAALAAAEANKYRKDFAAEGRAERTTKVQEGQLELSKEKAAEDRKIQLQKIEMELEREARLGKLNKAQIDQIYANINKEDADKYNITVAKDAFGDVTGVVVVNKKNPSEVKVISVPGAGGATARGEAAPSSSAPGGRQPSLIEAAMAERRRRDAEKNKGN
jgi:hypothetical protein